MWTGSASPLPDRGTSFARGVPIGPFATGLRLDLMSPPGAAPAPFDATYHWLRWALAFGSEQASIGTTFGWGFSSEPALDGYLSVTSGVTWRPAPSALRLVRRPRLERSRRAGPASRSSGAGSSGASRCAR